MYPRVLSKQEQTKCQISRQKEIIKTRAKSNEMGKTKTNAPITNTRNKLQHHKASTKPITVFALFYF